MSHPRTGYLDVVSNRRRGPLPTFLRMVLTPAAAVYRCIIGLRNRYFDWVPPASRSPGCPVISIGNITVGGTGKTPMAAKLANLLTARGRRVAILTRGYRGAEIRFDDDGREMAAAEWSKASDEARVLKRRCPRATVILNPDRLASAAEAIEKGADCIVLDDGFQHRRICRNLDIVLVDATNPFGFGRMLPRGLLREPVGSLRRASLIVLSRSDEISDAARAEIVRRIHRAAPKTPVIQSVQRITGFLDLKGRPIEGVDRSSIQAVIFAGVGNFESFRRSVDRLGVRILAAYEYPDHHFYTPDEIDGLAEAASTVEANAILTTEKDAVKLTGRWNDERCPVLVLNLDIEFLTDGDTILAQALDRALAGEDGDRLNSTQVA